MQEEKEKKNLPSVGFKKLKKILKKCRIRDHVPFQIALNEAITYQRGNNCPRDCKGCCSTLQYSQNEPSWFDPKKAKTWLTTLSSMMVDQSEKYKESVMESLKEVGEGSSFVSWKITLWPEDYSSHRSKCSVVKFCSLVYNLKEQREIFTMR
ncbi:hypothetical protein Bca52824_079767 [Brassica carinata]|uniref:Uncharacterized protein n=1 Tax=Brassica carinata TaxID=52824 RepID=A0A8X7Q093_BRACI|nr:hypothetical protein Bca52824_079767 [Brassica carinata]